jgi:hypothetical protein
MSFDPTDIPRESIWDDFPFFKWLAVGFVVFVVGYSLLDIATRRGPHPRIFQNEMNNMRQIGFALIEFEIEYDRMPDPSTIELVRERFPETWIPMGTASSNDYFHQLLAAKIVNSPSIFHGEGIATHKSSDLIQGKPPLPPGTCGFAYIIHDAKATIETTPLVVFPLVRGELVFDKKLCKENGKQAAVLYASGSVQRHPIDSKGRLILNGRDFFDPAQPHWNGGKFRVVWPE